MKEGPGIEIVEAGSTVQRNETEGLRATARTSREVEIDGPGSTENLPEKLAHPQMLNPNDAENLQHQPHRRKSPR